VKPKKEIKKALVLKEEYLKNKKGDRNENNKKCNKF
jgi:hypothetical protein